MKSGLFEGNKMKSYGDVGTSRGDVGSNKHGVGRQQAGATARLTDTARGGFSPTRSAPSAKTAVIKGDRPLSERVSRGLGTAVPKSGSERLSNMKIGLKGDIYTTKRGQ